MTKQNESKVVVRIVTIVVAAFSLLYLGQGLIVYTRLMQSDAKLVNLSLEKETCDQSDCTISFNFTAENRFLLAGHILRNHRILHSDDRSEIFPISQVKGTIADGWLRLKVYKMNVGERYTITATKPKQSRMGYFVGLLPRTTGHEGVLSIPDIGPTVSMITGLVMAFILLAMFGAAYMGGASWKGETQHSRYQLNAFAASGFFAMAGAFISLGILDSLLPEGDLRNKTLRISAVLALLIPTVAQIYFVKSKNSFYKIFASAIATILACLYLWPWIRGGVTWAMVLGSLTIAGCLSLIRLRLWLPAFVWSVMVLDPLKIMGYLVIPDYPPIYFNNVACFSALILVAGHLGGFATISMAGNAYRGFRRDLVLRAIQSSIESSDNSDVTARISGLKNILPDIAQLTGANRISVTISLPLGRPVTHTYDAESGEAKFYDDGKIPGAVTLRTIVYGDEAMFESFEEFAQRLRLPANQSLNGYRYFSAIPLRVNQTIVGTLMLTSFDDRAIQNHKQSKKAQFMQEDREIIHLVGERLSQSLSKLMVQNLDLITDLSRTLQSSIHQAIAASADAEEFLGRFVSSVASVCKMQVMLHEHVGDYGIGLVSAGMQGSHWTFFVQHPFNLSKTAVASYGPTVVAFRDSKSSYVKDVLEIADRMHIKTQEILKSMGTRSTIAIPVKTTNRSFVVTLLSGRESPPADPALVAVVEATEALFIAAIEVMSQKTSVLALGQLASRLIGDDEVRTKILDAAKDNNLATIIGSPRSSFLLLFDLAGSSDISEDTETKAQAYGKFYDAVNQKCLEVLGGMIRKTIGDAVIVTWDGTGVELEQRKTLLSDLQDVTVYADAVAKSIGCKGARAILHFGHYFLGLVGTKTFGQIDVIGS